MEENQQQLQGKQTAWYKVVKEEEFSMDAHITVQKRTDKVTNMKRAWNQAIRGSCRIIYEKHHQGTHRYIRPAMHSYDDRHSLP